MGAWNACRRSRRENKSNLEVKIHEIVKFVHVSSSFVMLKPTVRVVKWMYASATTLCDIVYIRVATGGNKCTLPMMLREGIYLLLVRPWLWSKHCFCLLRQAA